MRSVLLTFAVMVALSTLAIAGEQSEKWTGRISDSRCGKNVDAACSRKCIREGVPPVLVVDGTGEVLPISNQDAVRSYPGEHVEITGTLRANALRVGAVKVVEKPAAPAADDGAESYPGDYLVSADHVIGIDTFIGDDGKKALLFSDYKSGVVRRLLPVSGSEYTVGPGFSVASPVELRVRFARDGQSHRVSKLLVRAVDGTETSATRVPLSEKEVRFQGSDATLAGTLIMPDSKEPVPAIILLHGSGPLTRYSFGPYPHFFASLGFAVLVYDKRSAGSSTGEYLSKNAYYPEPFIQDALAAIHFLENQKRIRKSAIGLWGSSEGGMLATQVAARTRNVAFIINSSGFMMPLWKEMLYNRRARLRADGFPASEIAEAVKFQKLRFRVGRTGAGWDEFQKMRARLRDRKWFPMFFGEGTSRLETIRWQWLHVYSFNPLPAVGKVRCPVLGVFGALDTSTPAPVAVANMRRMLAKAGNADVTLKIFPDANHALAQAQTGSDAEIARSKGQAPGLFDTLRFWLLHRVHASE